MCCNKELAERVLKLLKMLYTDNLKESVTPLLCKLKKKVV